MNDKGDIGIFSNRALIVGAGVLLLIFILIFLNNNSQTEFQQNQTKVVEELKGNIQTLTGSLDSIKTSVLLLNQNIAELEKSKANEATVNELSSEVQKLNSNIEKTNQNLETVNQRLTAVEENVKVIEPSTVQNVDIRDLRTYINITNFRLILNFFIAVTISLFSIELIKLFGDFLSFGYLTKNYDIKKYFAYKKMKKHNEINVYQISTSAVENTTSDLKVAK